MDNYTILHISDLHFGHGNATNKSDQMMIVYEIIRDAKEIANTIGPPHVVLITGDIAFKANQESEYTDALSWIRHLCNELNISPSSVMCVPGNHDIERTKICDHPIRKWTHQALKDNPNQLDELMLQNDGLGVIWPKLENYTDFIESYGGKTISADRPFWVINDHSSLGGVSIIGLNTVLLSCDDGDSNSSLLLGQEQIRSGIYDQPDDSLLLVLQHHPPSWLRDGNEILGWLKGRPHILFTGHIHDQGSTVSLELDGRGILNLSAGAAHGDFGTEHGYSWLTISTAGVEFFPRVWARSKKRFVADRNNFNATTDNGSVEYHKRYLPKALQSWIEKTNYLDKYKRKNDERVSCEEKQDTHFEDNIARIFKLQGFNVLRSVDVNGQLIDIVVEESSLLKPITYLVFCFDQPSPISFSEFSQVLRVVKNASKAAKNNSIIQGIIISTVGFSKEVEAEQKRTDIILYRLSDFEQSVVKFGNYIGELIDDLSVDSDIAYFVEPSMLRSGRTVPEPALGIIEKWLNDSNSNHLTLLGDYGTGKTTLLKYLALRMARKYEREKSHGSRVRVPVLIDLGKYSFARSLTLIRDDIAVKSSLFSCQSVDFIA